MENLRAILKDKSDILVAYSLCALMYGEKDRNAYASFMTNLGQIYQIFEWETTISVAPQITLDRVKDITQISPSDYRKILSFEEQIQDIESEAAQIMANEESLLVELGNSNEITPEREDQIHIKRLLNNKRLEELSVEVADKAFTHSSFKTFISQDPREVVTARHKAVVIGDVVMRASGAEEQLYDYGVFYNDRNEEHKEAIQKLRKIERELR